MVKSNCVFDSVPRSRGRPAGRKASRTDMGSKPKKHVMDAGDSESRQGERREETDGHPKPRSWRAPVVVFVVAAGIMTVYEILKQVIAPRITIWQSHAATIAVSALLAAAASYVIRQKYRALLDRAREAEVRYRNLYAGVPIGLFRSTPDGRFLHANPAMVRLLGCTDLLELSSSNATEFYRDPADRDRWRRRVETGETVINFEVPLKRRDGIIIWVRNTVRAVRDREGEILFYEGTLEDITERKQAEAERLRMERKLQQTQKLESLGVLAGGIAHDFNNILMVVLGNAELALKELDRLSPVRELMTEITDAARQAAELCRQMLAYSGRTFLAREPLDLPALIKDMSSLFNVTISRGVDLKLDLAPALLNGDPGQLRQVLLNLVINASEAIGDRGGVITISTGTVFCGTEELERTAAGAGLPEGEYAFLQVADNGVGMDEETRRRIFEPFFTTKFTGRGLGLAAVLGIVQGHRGAITVKSALEEGTSFRAIFPVLTPEPPVPDGITGGSPG